MSKNKKMNKVFSGATAFCLILSLSNIKANASTLAPEKLGGYDRFDTAIKIAEESWKGKWKNSKNAILASGNNKNLVDALAVAPLAYELEAPILLDDADKDVVNRDTLKALKDNGVDTVYIASGSGVISYRAERQLENAGMKVVRLGGRDRYDTARNIYDKFIELGGSDKNVALVSDTGLADALSIAPIAAREGMPIILTRGTNSVTYDLRDVADRADKVYAIGGYGVISDALVDRLNADRLGGDNRYDTNAQVVNAFVRDGKVKFDKVYFAYGADANLVDALTGSVLAAQNEAPVVLTNNDLYRMKDTEYMLKSNLKDNTELNSFGRVVSNNFLYDVLDINEIHEERGIKDIDALNLKQIVVSFSGSIDRDEACNIDNYSIEDSHGHDIDIDNIEVIGNKATITFADNFENKKDGAKFKNYPIKNQDKITVTVDKSLIDSNKDYEKEIELTDLTIPKVESAEVIGIDTIKVKFSEPMKPEYADFDSDDNVTKVYADKNAFEVQGEKEYKHYIKEVELVNNNTEANIKLYSDLDDDEEVSVKVKGIIEDYAEYGAVGQIRDIEVVKDDEKPYVIDYRSAAKNKVTLVFNEDVEANGTLSTSKDDGVTYYDDFYHTNSKNKATNVQIDGKEITLTFSKNSLPDGIAYIYINDDVLRDFWDNKNDNIRFEIESEIDRTRPTISKIEQGDDEKAIEVEFSEEVEEDSAEDKDNYILEDEDGHKVRIKRVELKDDKNRDTVIITTSDKLDGEYTLYVEDVKDLSNNKMEKEHEDFEMTDKTNPDIDDDKVSAHYYSAGDTDQVIVVDFGERMLADGSNYAVDNVENYRIIGSAYDKNGCLVRINKDLSELYDADIHAIDNGRKIEIQLPFDDDESKSYSFKGKNVDVALEIARVKDASGNRTRSFSSKLHVDNQDYITYDKNNPPKAIDTDKVQITFNDDFAFDEEDIKVCADDASHTELRISGIKTSRNNDGNLVVTYTLASMDKLNHDGTFGNDDKDIYNQNIGSNVYVEPTGKTYSNNRYGATLNPDAKPILVDDNIKPAIQKYGEYEVNSEGHSIEDKDKVESYLGHIKIYFEEPIDNRSLSTTTFEIEDDDYKITQITSLDEENRDSNVITLTLNKNTVPEEGVQITQAAPIRDVNFNAVKEIDTEVAKNVESIRIAKMEKEAKSAVEKAEHQAVEETRKDAVKSGTLDASHYYDEASNLVTALPDGKVRTDLVNRLQAVKSIIDATQAVENVEQKVAEKADQSEISADYKATKVLVDKLQNETAKKNLNFRLDAVDKIINSVKDDKLNKAEEAVANAEASNLQADYDAAMKLVIALPDGTEKTNLTARLKVVKQTIDNNNALKANIDKATQAVVNAEASNLQADYDAATKLVEALPKGTARDSLTARLQAVKDIIDDNNALKANIVEATNAVAKAEKSNLQADYNTAMKLVEALPEGETKNSLLDRLNAVLQKIKNVKALTDAKNTLNLTITAATNLKNSAIQTSTTQKVGTYAQSDINALSSAISAADTVYKTNTSKIEEINQSNSDLNTAINVFKSKVVKAQIKTVIITPTQLNIVTSNQVNQSNSIVIDEYGNYSIKFGASFKDQDGRIVDLNKFPNKELSWSVSYDNNNGTRNVTEINKKLSIEPDGTLMVDRDAPNGNIIVTASLLDVSNSQSKVISTSKATVTKNVVLFKTSILQGANSSAATITLNKPLYTKDSAGVLKLNTNFNFMQSTDVNFKPAFKVVKSDNTEVAGAIGSAIYTTGTSGTKIVFTFNKDQTGKSKITNGCKLIFDNSSVKYYDSLGNVLQTQNDGTIAIFNGTIWE